MQIFGFFRFGTISVIRQDGDEARIDIAPATGNNHDGGLTVTLVYEGVTELQVTSSTDGSVVSNVTVLTACQFLILQTVVDGDYLSVLVAASQPQNQLYTGVLRIRANTFRLLDVDGRLLSIDEVARWAQRAVAKRLSAGSVQEYRKLLDRILKDEVRPLLTAAGFTTDKRAFVRANEGVVGILALDVDRHPSAESISVSLRVTIFVGSMDTKTKLTEQEVTMNTYPAYQRVFAPPHIFTRDLNATFMAMRLVGEIKDLALPLMERMSTFDDILLYLEHEDVASGVNRHAYTMAMLLGRAGRTDEARIHFQRALGDHAAIQRAAAMFGITL